MNTDGRTGPGLPSPKDKPRIRMMAVSIPRVRRHIKNNLMFKERKLKDQSRFAEEGLRGNGCLLSDLVDVQLDAEE